MSILMFSFLCYSHRLVSRMIFFFAPMVSSSIIKLVINSILMLTSVFKFIPKNVLRKILYFDHSVNPPIRHGRKNSTGLKQRRDCITSAIATRETLEGKFPALSRGFSDCFSGRLSPTDERNLFLRPRRRRLVSS
ncbi:hypothetical protein PUN28_006823 [Cardiocondyla obscurior]|uniref:Uncharacterized protein n=1 Tax=Cardiocondyla obscurior TaxID=286306 RepID=A0AAW2G1Y8_9HYME